MRGRPQITGRYDTRQELEYWVWHFYKETSANVTDVARICKVSDATANNILNRKRPREDPPECDDPGIEYQKED